MNIRERLIEALEPLGYEIALQGSYTDVLPNSFITYTIADSTDISHYDNKPELTSWYLQVNFYSDKMSLINSVPSLISDALLDAGFRRDGKGIDTGLDKDTGRYGWLMDYYYMERN